MPVSYHTCGYSDPWVKLHTHTKLVFVFSPCIAVTTSWSRMFLRVKMRVERESTSDDETVSTLSPSQVYPSCWGQVTRNTTGVFIAVLTCWFMTSLLIYAADICWFIAAIVSVRVGWHLTWLVEAIGISHGWVRVFFLPKRAGRVWDE